MVEDGIESDDWLEKPDDCVDETPYLVNKSPMTGLRGSYSRLGTLRQRIRFSLLLRLNVYVPNPPFIS